MSQLFQPNYIYIGSLFKQHEEPFHEISETSFGPTQIALSKRTKNPNFRLPDTIISSHFEEPPKVVHNMKAESSGIVWKISSNLVKIWACGGKKMTTSIHCTKKWSFPLWISSVNVTKSVGNCGFGYIYIVSVTLFGFFSSISQNL